MAGYCEDSENLYQLHEQYGGDFIWSGSAFWGIPWLEAALGCPIYASHETGSIISKQPAGFKGPVSIPDFNPNDPWPAKAVEFIQALAEKSNGRWPIGTTRMRGLSDLLSALYGGEAFIFKMMENPGEVEEALCKLTDFFIEFAQLQLAHIPLFHDGVGSFYYNMWAPKGTVWLQEDAAALLSPDMYEKFILPWDRKLIETFEASIMHMHPTGFYPWRQMLTTDITCLELHIDAGGASAEQLYGVHSEILKSKPLLIWGDIPDTDLDWIFSKLPAHGLAVNVAVDSPDQAKELWDKYIGE